MPRAILGGWAQLPLDIYNSLFSHLLLAKNSPIQLFLSPFSSSPTRRCHYLCLKFQAPWAVPDLISLAPWKPFFKQFISLRPPLSQPSLDTFFPRFVLSALLLSRGYNILLPLPRPAVSMTVIPRETSRITWGTIGGDADGPSSI